jgi:hypothetical protein
MGQDVLEKFRIPLVKQLFKKKHTQHLSTTLFRATLQELVEALCYKPAARGFDSQ